MSTQPRHAPLDLPPDEFRALGHRLVDRIADFLATLPSRPVAPANPLPAIRAALPAGPLPESGAAADELLDHVARTLFEHSLFNGHPRFWGYITSSAAPIGALADLLAAAVNPNVGSFALAPVATEIERQAVRWIAELVGFTPDAGGLLVSGGNMANFVCFLAARTARAGQDVRSAGLAAADAPRLRVYASTETHTWIHKAADLFGLGTDAIRWIPVDAGLRMSAAALHETVREDLLKGDQPLLVVANAGTVATGAVDPIPAIAEVCRELGVWLHVDGAYGALAAAAPGAPPDLAGIALADSVAVDPHKWLYTPLEAGCALVRDDQALLDAFSYRPSYYRFEGAGDGEPPLNFYELGPQNSRGFRALKVWLGLRQAGRQGYARMIADDMRLAERLFDNASRHPELEAATSSLSIVTFRFVPEDVDRTAPGAEAYLNELNSDLLGEIQASGEAYLSNAVVGGRYLLRACIVNFRTAERDVDALPEIVVRLGRRLHARKRARTAGGQG